RANFLSRRAVDADDEHGWNCAAARTGSCTSDQLAHSRRARTGESHVINRCADLLELPLVFCKWKDDGYRSGWAEQRQGALRNHAGAEACVDRGQPGCPVEYRWTRRQDQGRLYVSGVAGWAVCAEHILRVDARFFADCVREEFLGLSISAGVLSDEGDPGVLRPNDGKTAAAAGG